ncbi:MAG: glycosyl transferase family 1 [Flavobacteriaceae bacterium]|nr:MAG: glycosyl transferase family 1 [Flavobacteriaceae bacterium]
MKIAMVTPFPPSKITLNEYAYHLVKEFCQKDEIDEIVLITDHTKNKKTIDFYTVDCLVTIKESWKFNSYFNLFTILSTILKERPDVVLFNIQFMTFGDKKIPAALGLLLPFFLKIFRVPNVVLLHNILEQVDLSEAGISKNKISQWFYYKIGTLLTRLILETDVLAVTISKYVKILQKKYHKNNIVHIPHGSFRIPSRTHFDIPKGTKKILTFGKFGTYKKVEVLIEAVEKLRKRSKETFEIIIAGTDSPNSKGYLQAVAQKYKHVKGLTFTGYVEEEDVAKVFEDSTVVVFPYSSTTGSSGVLHQAGCYGKAVILPDIGDLSLLIREEGYNGEFFKPTDSDSLSNAIEKIISNDAYRMELAITNYNAACSLPLTIIADMYIVYFSKLRTNNVKHFLVSNK